MSLPNFVSKTINFARNVALDIKQIRTWIGNLTGLTTTNKTSVVAAINEINNWGNHSLAGYYKGQSVGVITDLNDIFNIGSYAVTNANASSVLNKPLSTSVGFKIMVFRQGNYLIQEVVYNQTPNRRFYRINNAGGNASNWGDWREIIHSGVFDPSQYIKKGTNNVDSSGQPFSIDANGYEVDWGGDGLFSINHTQHKLMFEGTFGEIRLYNNVGSSRLNIATDSINFRKDGNQSSILRNNYGNSRLRMPDTGDSERNIPIGVKLNSGTYYANSVGIIEMDEIGGDSPLNRLNNTRVEFMAFSNLRVDNITLNQYVNISKEQLIEGTNYFMREPYVYMKGEGLPEILMELINEGYSVMAQFGRFLPKRHRRQPAPEFEINNPIDSIAKFHQPAKYRYRKLYVNDDYFSAKDIVDITDWMLLDAMDKKSKYIKLSKLDLHSFHKIKYIDTTIANQYGVFPTSDFIGLKGLGNVKRPLKLCVRFVLKKNDITHYTPTLGYLECRVNRIHQQDGKHSGFFTRNAKLGHGMIGSYNVVQIK